MNKCTRTFFTCIKTVNSFKVHNPRSNIRCISQKGLVSYNLVTSKVLYTFSQQQGNNPNDALKKESKEFYENYVNDIIELQQSKDWPMVVSNTAEPLIIDFYADWCGPCKKLTPILEERVKKTQGKIKLLKVNIDKCG